MKPFIFPILFWIVSALLVLELIHEYREDQRAELMLRPTVATYPEGK